VLVVLLLGLELVLKAFIPYQMLTIGHLNSPNAQLYGCGFNPHKRMVVLDPDTKQGYVSHANSRG
jgi:hypothetical protein